MSKKTKTDSELQGLTHLIVDATIGVTDLVEEIHKQVVHPPFLPSTSIQKLISKIAGFTFNNIRWSTKLIGNSISKILEYVTPAISNIKSSDKKEVLLSVLNGVIGDYLEEKENPLKIEMQFRFQSKAIEINAESLKETYPKINGKILLMIHGSCMSDIQWTRKNHNHGEILSEELEKTPIYLNYNSGKHISINGKDLNKNIQKLVENWPVPVEEIVIIAHSMGGLLTRSALYYADQNQNNWTKHLKKVAFLGTPHHGSHIERIGNYVDLILESVPYLKPFARLGKIRSAGVTDLRYGNLVDEDWQNNGRFERKGDQRQHIQLAKNIDFYAVAAIIGKETAGSAKILGDSLVDVKSALGQHKKTEKNLDFKLENTLIVYENNHLDLLSNLEITEKLKIWLV
ncbi:esterase/lipase family protein [Polaribacter glomeratus]|nr:permease [Polaribacter glomeratus]TXD66883.1 alpha/beta hydrolase [Polaribacter glomeratus]